MTTLLQAGFAICSSTTYLPLHHVNNAKVHSKSLQLISNSRHFQSHPENSRVFYVQKGARFVHSRISCSADAVKPEEGPESVKERSVSVILLAGGKGKRMGCVSFVADVAFREHAKAVSSTFRPTDCIVQAVDSNSELVCIHDSARPLASSSDIRKVLKDGWLIGASVLGVPAKATIKEANSDSFVVKTLDRRTLWEMQTPQVIKPELLKSGFELVNREGLEVTDDVSIVEHLKHPVYITEGSYTNIKVTTPDDLLLAERILNTTSAESS
ncbi:hypothetical protein RJ640_019289 [Escallonia rubra]|uniref:2-C-methyl-D-erythritol 4-phosphate cytidylyltransferase n=1 Tax=Escallonia rubra TaxID=112253 RepID=A0AA88RPD6_9ASTE|nr:hypothetical protein RJ640_019289 [Escallonia rubra]